MRSIDAPQSSNLSAHRRLNTRINRFQFSKTLNTYNPTIGQEFDFIVSARVLVCLCKYVCGAWMEGRGAAQLSTHQTWHSCFLGAGLTYQAPHEHSHAAALCHPLLGACSSCCGSRAARHTHTHTLKRLCMPTTHSRRWRTCRSST